MPRRIPARTACLVACAALLAACTPTGSGTEARAGLRGGTLRVALPPGAARSLLSGVAGPPAQVLDPQQDLWLDSAEVFRCCLLRTLFSYVGRPTDQGGSVLRNDLAEQAPTVSRDGLTWEIRLRRGVHYSPPLSRVEVTAPDFVRSIERSARFMGPGILPIAGFDDYAGGKVASISGIATPDPFTLRFTLTQPEGNFGYLLSAPNTAPIPPLPGDAAAALGVATGHDAGYGQFLVSTGPYMIEGSDRLDFTRPPSQQAPVSGLVPGRSVTLVRNPSWSPASDGLRPAYADRIVLTVEPSLLQAAADVDGDRQDLVLLSLPSLQAPAAQIRRYQTDPTLGRVEVEPRDFVRFVTLNTAVPPLDDLNVRKAIAYAIDKSALVQLHGGPILAAQTGHYALDSMEDGALLNFDPYHGRDGRPNLDAARAAMRASRYDADQDGKCDGAVCQNVEALVLPSGTFPQEGQSIAADLQAIGLGLKVVPMPPKALFDKLGDPAQHIAMSLDTGEGKDYPSAADFMSLFSAQAIPNGLGTLLGATPAQLQGWGYGVPQVPSVDDRIAYCDSLVDNLQTPCWTQLDVYLMKNVLPVIPVYVDQHVEVVPARIRSYSFDQLNCLPALDQIMIAH